MTEFPVIPGGISCREVVELVSDYLEGILQNADLSVYANCGHWSMIDRNADFNRQVRDFLLHS